MKNGRKKNPSRPAESAPAVRLSGWKLWAMRLFAAIALPVFMLTVVELALRVSGAGYSTSFLLPSMNHGRKAFVQNNKFGWRFFGKRKSRTPAALSMDQEKSPDVVRIFVLGESAAFGDPQPEFGLPRVLQATLSLRHPGLKFEVENVAMTAINSHVILPIARDCTRAHGDIWVIYMGNNEVVGPFGAGTVFGSQAPPLSFVRANLAIKTTRLGQLIEMAGEKWHKPSGDTSEWGGMLMFLGQQVRADDPRLNTVYKNFERNLSDIIRAGRDSGAGVVVSTVAVNLKDCAPFASSAGAEETSAEAQFRLGRQLLEAGDLVHAHAALEKARDLDTLRFRCDSRLNDLIRKTADGRENERVLLADAERAFADASPQGVPGWNFFYEHVHLTFEGNCLLARVIAAQVEKLMLQTSPGATATWPAPADCGRRLGRSPADLEAAVEEVLKRLSDAPFTSQLNHREHVDYLTGEARKTAAEMNSDGALQTARAALSFSPEDAVLHEHLAALEESAGHDESAEAEAQRAVDLLPSSAEDWSQLGSIFVREKKYDAALRAYQTAFDLNLEDVFALQNVAMSLSKLGRDQEALQAYRRALAITPRFGMAWLGLGQLYDKMGQGVEATNCYQKALQNPIHRAPDLATVARFCMTRAWYQAAATNFDSALSLGPADSNLQLEAGRAHFLYGMELGKSNQPALAAQQFGQAVRLMPGIVEARLNFGIALYQSGQFLEARPQFDEVLTRSPDNGTARHYLELIRNSAVK